MITSLLDEAKIDLSMIQGIVYGCGPGSFTGLRVGIAFAQGLAYAQHWPMIPVSSLRSLAFAHKQTSTKADAIFCAMDARMGEVYACAYAVEHDGGLKALMPETLSDPKTLSWPTVSGNILALGNAFSVYEKELSKDFAAMTSPQIIYPSAKGLLASIEDLSRAKPCKTLNPKVVYLREKVAQIKSQ